MAPVLADAPDDVLQLIAHDVGRWLENAAKAFDRDETLFLDLCRRILALEYQDDADEDTDDPLTRAINHPVGRVTEALLRWWSRSPLEDGQGLPDRLKPVFTELCDARIGKFRHGRVLMAARIITLFRVDHEWAARHLLPLFSWRCCEAEARTAWKGFLSSPRLYRPLMESIKESFLDTARHYEALGGDGEQYADLLTFAALDRGNTFTTRELAAATAELPEEGLRQAADALVRALDSSGERRTEYWRNRALPYLRWVWPNSPDLRTPAVSEGLGKVCIAAGEAFPEALKKLRHWLQPPQYPGHLMHRLRESGLCDKFPEDTLFFLELVANGPMWVNDLKKCLEQIRKVESELENDQRFRVLRERLRQFGQELE